MFNSHNKNARFNCIFFIQFQVPKCTRTHLREKQFPKIFNTGVAYPSLQTAPLVARLPGFADFFLWGGPAVCLTPQLFLCNSHTAQLSSESLNLMIDTYTSMRLASGHLGDCEWSQWAIAPWQTRSAYVNYYAVMVVGAALFLSMLLSK
jgi:hypothetical protein